MVNLKANVARIFEILWNVCSVYRTDSGEIHVYRASKIIVIGDGAKWIKGFIDTYCNGLDVQYILDMSHMKSNIFKFSESVIRGKRKQNIWANTVLQLLLEGKIDEALTMTEPFKDIKREGIPNLYNYI